VAGNRIRKLDKNRPCIQIAFHDPEGFFNPPELVVNTINFKRIHLDLGSNNAVVSCKVKVFVGGLLVEADSCLPARFLKGKYPRCRSGVFPPI